MSLIYQLKENKGFTLVELLVAIAIFSIAITLVTYAFRQSINIVKYINFPYAEDLQKLSKVRDSIRSTFFYLTQNDTAESPSKIFQFFFYGNKNKISFVTAKPILIKSREIVLVTLEKEKDKLVWKEYPVYDKDTDYKTLKSRKKPRRLIILDNIKIATFSFIKDNIEKSYIEKTFPDAIKIVIKKKDKKENYTYYFRIISNAYPKKEKGDTIYEEF